MDSAYVNSDHLVVSIATIGRSVGLDGWCRIFPSGNSLEKLSLPVEISFGRVNPEKCVVLEKLKKTPKGMMAFFDGYSDCDEIALLKNGQLFMDHNNLPSIEDNEYYHFELKGMKVCFIDSMEEVGVVVDVYNYPTVDALEVEMKNRHRFILPITDDTVLQIDKVKKIILTDRFVVDELL